MVVDSSVVLRVCLAGGAPGTLAGHRLHAPAHLPAEVTSALRELSWRGEIPGDRGREALDYLAALPITYAAPGSLALISPGPSYGSSGAGAVAMFATLKATERSSGSVRARATSIRVGEISKP